MYEHAINAMKSGRPHEALALLRRLAPFRTHDPDWFVNVANAHEDLGETDKAELAYRGVLLRWPDHLPALSSLGNLCARTGRLDEAEQIHRRALKLSRDPYSLTALAFTQMEQLQIEESLGNLLEAANRDPTAAISSTYLGYSLHAGYDREAHEQWTRKFAPPNVSKPLLQWDGQRPLRVAYVGECFRDHATARCLEPILVNHDREKVTPVIYSDVLRGDETTARMKTLVDLWTPTAHLSHAQLANIIRQDEIDVVIDLQGHNAPSRMLALARHPAPIMLGYIGYGGDTLLTENVDAEVGWAYQPSQEAPPIAPLPAAANGYITFGSLHRGAKITAGTATLWAKVLEAVPDSILMVAVQGGEANTQARKKLVDCGVPADRLELVPRPPTRMEYLSLADRMDIHLDAFPYTGGATTFDLLWQGVPTITMRNHAMGAKIAFDYAPWILVPVNEDEFVDAAAGYARDIPLLEGLRWNLRNQERFRSLASAVTFGLEKLIHARATKARDAPTPAAEPCCA